MTEANRIPLKQMDITPAQIIGKSPDFHPTNIKFPKGGSTLNAAAVNNLEDYSDRLQAESNIQLFSAFFCSSSFFPSIIQASFFSSRTFISFSPIRI